MNLLDTFVLTIAIVIWVFVVFGQYLKILDREEE
jgi:hypothetical protein